LSYEDEIIKRVDSAYGVFRPPTIGVKEYPLLLYRRTGKADFCFEFAKTGLLFIEAEDDPAQRALNNLVKYWRWCKENPKFQPVYVISICGPENMNTDSCLFVKEKIEKDIAYFKCHLITHGGADNWHKADADWLKKLESICKEIGSRPRECTVFNG